MGSQYNQDYNNERRMPKEENKKKYDECYAVPIPVCEVGMRLRGRDPQGSALPWIANVLGVQSVRLRLRLDRRDNKGKGCWQLVDLGGGNERSCRKLRDRIQPASSQSPMSIPAASVQKQDNSEMQSPAMSPTFIPGQRGKIPGRKRGRPPLRSTVSKMDFQNRYSESLSPLKVPKKRGRKPGFKLKSRIVMTPLAISPPSSTPEPDMSSIPQDAATVPHSVTPQVLTATFDGKQHLLSLPVVNSIGYVLRFLKKMCRSLHCENLFSDQPFMQHNAASYHSEKYFEGNAHSSEYLQNTANTPIFYGGEKISATFDGKQHLLSLPVVNSIGYVLRFLKKMCRSLHCENLFSDQPFMQHNAASYHSEKYFEGNAHSTEQAHEN
ncbi:UNVERIFIED_CONTAM: hypothetical protein FKN15_046510 [Acipenser sinensis]